MEKRTKHLKKNTVAETFGWVSAALVLAGYGLASLNIITSNSLIYNGLFFVGSVGLAVVTYRHRAFQSFSVNSIFIVLSIIAIIRLLLA